MASSLRRAPRHGGLLRFWPALAIAVVLSLTTTYLASPGEVRSGLPRAPAEVFGHPANLKAARSAASCEAGACALPRSPVAAPVAPLSPRPLSDQLGSSATNWWVANWSGEGMIAENPSNPLNLVSGGAYQLGGAFNASTYYSTGISGAFTSFDGGRSWTQQTLPQYPGWTNPNSATCDQGHLADTAIAFGKNNTVYYVDLSYPLGNTVCLVATASIGLYVTISYDGGVSWNTPIPIAGTVAGASMDKPWIAIDQTTGELYVGYNDDSNGTLVVRNSTDSGQSWSNEVVVSSDSTRGIELVVDPYGGVDATYYDNSLGAIEFVRSTNQGKSFSAAKQLGAAPYSTSNYPDGFRAYTLPGIGVDGYAGNAYTGRLFVTWQNGSGGVAGSPAISLAYSSNNGSKWTAPRTVNSNATPMNYQPDVAVGPDGTVYTEWYGVRATDGHYRLYAALSHNGGRTFDSQITVSDNDSLPRYRVGGLGGWWIGDYTHIIADQWGARPLWTDARSGLSWTCSPCLWGVNYNISFYTAEVVNETVGSNVPVNITLGGTVPLPGTISPGPAPVAVDALAGDNVSLSAPATVMVNGSTEYFSVWYGTTYTSNLTINATARGADRWFACYVPTVGAPCRAPGAPGYLNVSVTPANATVKVNHTLAATPSGHGRLLLGPGSYVVQAWAWGRWPSTVWVNVTAGDTAYANLTLTLVQGTLNGSVAPVQATVRLNGTVLGHAPNGSFSTPLNPGLYELAATLFGYATYVNSSVRIQFNQTTSVPINLTALPGWINGTVAPGNASVTVNGVPVPVTNGQYSIVEHVGTYWVNATATGYYSYQSGPLVMGPFGRVTANVSLVLILGTLAGSVTPINAQVWIAGQPVNVTSGTFSVTLPPGDYTVNASASQYSPHTTIARVKAANTTILTLVLPLAPGWISATVSPSNASVTVDGRPVTVSASGTFNVTVPSGAHYVNATVPGFGEVDRIVRVNPGATTAVHLVLSALAGNSSSGLYLGAGIAVVAIALVLAVVLVWRRRRRPPPTAEEPASTGDSDSPG